MKRKCPAMETETCPGMEMGIRPETGTATARVELRRATVMVTGPAVWRTSRQLVARVVTDLLIVTWDQAVLSSETDPPSALGVGAARSEAQGP